MGSRCRCMDTEQCSECRKSKALSCSRKRRYDTWSDADMAVAEHVTRNILLTRYPCRWCEGWHLANPATKVARKRVEKARRRRLWKVAT